jgi:hypothetical protein
VKRRADGPAGEGAERDALVVPRLLRTERRTPPELDDPIAVLHEDPRVDGNGSPTRRHEHADREREDRVFRYCEGQGLDVERFRRRRAAYAVIVVDFATVSAGCSLIAGVGCVVRSKTTGHCGT